MYNTMLINGGQYLLHGVICANVPFAIPWLTVKIPDIDTEVVERNIGDAA